MGMMATGLRVENAMRNCSNVTRLGGLEAEVDDLLNRIDSLEDIIEQKNKTIETYEKVAPAQQREQIASLIKDNKRLETENITLKAQKDLVEQNAMLRIREVEHKLKLADNSKKTAWGNVVDRNSKLTHVEATLDKQDNTIKQKDYTINKQVDMIERKDLKIEGLEETLENTKQTLLIVTENKRMLEEQIERQEETIKILREALVGINEVHDIISKNNESLNAVENIKLPAVPGRRGLFNSKSDAYDKIRKLIDAANCKLTTGQKSNKDIAKQYGYKGTAYFEGNIKTHRENGVYEIIEQFVTDKYVVTDALRGTYESNVDYDYRSLLDILDKHEYETD